MNALQEYHKQQNLYLMEHLEFCWKLLQHENNFQNKHSQVDGKQRVKCTAQWSTQSYNLASQAKLPKENAGPEF